MDTLQGSGIPGQVVGGIPMVGSHATFGALQSPMDTVLIKGAKARCIIGNTLVLKDGKPVFSAGSPGNIHCTLPQVLTYLRSEEHTSELQSLMRISYAVFCLKKKTTNTKTQKINYYTT